VNVWSRTAPAGRRGLTYARAIPRPCCARLLPTSPPPPSRPRWRSRWLQARQAVVDQPRLQYEEVSRTTFHVENRPRTRSRPRHTTAPTKRSVSRPLHAGDDVGPVPRHINVAKPGHPADGADGRRACPSAAYAAVLRDVRLADGHLSASPTDTVFLEGPPWVALQQLLGVGHYRYRRPEERRVELLTWGHAMHMPASTSGWLSPRFTMAAGWGIRRTPLGYAVQALNFGG